MASNHHLVTEKADILIAPKTIYWIGMPEDIEFKDKIELLKRDFLIYGCDLEEVDALHKKADEYAAYVFNLDQIMNYGMYSNLKDPIVVGEGVIKLIKKMQTGRIVVHTSIIDQELEALFKNEKVPLIQKNLGLRRVALSTVFKVLTPLFAKDNQIHRSYVRLSINQQLKYTVKVSIIKEKPHALEPEIKLDAYLKDISMNGVGIYFSEENSENLNKLKLRQKAALEIQIPHNTLVIKSAIVTRMHEPTLEAGFHFNHANHAMIDENNTNTLSGLIYQYLKEILSR